MVADRVEVRTRRAGTAEAWRWTSDGKGSYAVAALPLERRRRCAARASRCTSRRRPQKEFLEPWRVERLIKEHSWCRRGADRPPGDPRRRTPPPDRRRGPVGQVDRSEITPEQYTEFYRSLAAQYDEPALTIHYRAEGPARVFGAGLRAGLEALRSLRSPAQGPHQALRAPGADHRRGRSPARLAALRARRGRHRRPAAQRVARDGAELARLRGDPQGRHQPRAGRPHQDGRRRCRKASPRSGRTSGPC